MNRKTRILGIILAGVILVAGVSCPACGDQVARWEGEGIKETEPFLVNSNEWKISWETEPGPALSGVSTEGMFIVMVFEAAEAPANPMPVIAANVMGKNSGSKVMSGQGSYRMVINTAQKYVVTVEE